MDDIEGFLAFGGETPELPTVRLIFEAGAGIPLRQLADILEGLDDAMSYVNGPPISQDETWRLRIYSMSPDLGDMVLSMVSTPRAVPWDEAEAAVSFVQKIQEVMDGGVGNRFDGGRYERAVYSLAGAVIDGTARAIRLELDDYDIPALVFDAQTSARILSDRRARQTLEAGARES